MPVKAEGQLLAGRYRVLGRLGTGGMATVFLCEDTRLGRRVAVKRLHAESPTDTARRFQREAKLGASLNHQNVVSIFDTVSDADGVLIVMEYVDGPHLGALVQREGRLEPQRALQILRGVADALDHAHEHGVVHRDVKPANVLIASSGEAKLVDLGIAMALESTRITRSGTVLGTAAYMSPEQIDGATPGPAADVYSLAAVAFEVLSGRKARVGRTPVEIARRVISAPPPRLSEAWPDAPRAVEDVLCRAMSRDPRERPVTAGALVAELERAFAARRGAAPLDGNGARPRAERPAPAAAQPQRAAPGAPRRAPHRARRELAWLIPALVVAVAALAIAGFFLLGGGDDRVDAPRDEPPAEQRSGGGERGGGEPESPQGGGGPAPSEQPAEGDGYEVPQPSGDDPARGARLDRQGKSLIDQGNYDEAVPVLEEAVRSFPPETQDLSYAFALYNLGNALRLAGRPEDAIPVLEKRLEIPNQRGVVRRELERARADAAG